MLPSPSLHIFIYKSRILPSFSRYPRLQTPFSVRPSTSSNFWKKILIIRKNIFDLFDYFNHFKVELKKLILILLLGFKGITLNLSFRALWCHWGTQRSPIQPITMISFFQSLLYYAKNLQAAYWPKCYFMHFPLWVKTENLSMKTY